MAWVTLMTSSAALLTRFVSSEVGREERPHPLLANSGALPPNGSRS